MYTPPRYRETDSAAIQAFMQAHSFAVLVSHDGQRPEATHVPLFYRPAPEGWGRLLGHVARANPQWRSWAAQPAQTVLAIFAGPHAYVSPSWYEQPNVPTWNYQAVHVYGQLRIIEGAELQASLRELMDGFEGQMPAPRLMDSLPAGMVEREMRGIVGFELRITAVEAQAKLSQNRHDQDHARIVAELESSADPAAQQVAAAMRQQRPA